MLLFTQNTYDKVMHYLHSNLYNISDIHYLFSILESHGQIILIGGSIKDIGFFNKKPKDFDIVVKTTNPIDLSTLPNGFKIGRNAFGEIKLSYFDLIFDIMTAKDESELYNKTIQFNTDGILMNISAGSYDAAIYNSAIEEGTIKIVSQKYNHPDNQKTINRLKKYANKLDLKTE